jgi:4-amino-4-deoxy-L-arabinose transferase-like glycosyltransferase
MTAKQCKWLLLIAVFSFLPAIFYFYVGEEAIFPIISLEMWHQQDWTRQHLFGLNPQHNPFFNWLIMPLAALAGWQHVLEITRAITIASTVATAAVVGWLVWRLLRDRALAWFAGLVYLTFADVLFYRGWLAYVDPLFGLCVFGAIAALWIACEEGRPLLLGVSVLSLTCAFLSKAFTAYVFYGGAVFVLLFYPRYRRVLFGVPSLAFHALAACAPLLWLGLVPTNSGQGGRMFFEVLAKLMPAGLFEYLRQLIGYPVETLLRLSPAVPLAIVFFWKKRFDMGTREKNYLTTALAIAAVGYLPYWLAPVSAIRYLTPVYPMIAVAVSLVLWSSGTTALTATRRWLTGSLAVKVLAALLLFPYYQSHYRGENYFQAAADIMKISTGHALYTTNDTASGLSVAGYIDSKWRQTDPIQWLPQDWQGGYVIAEVPDSSVGEVAARFKLGGDELYLLCRGAACAAAQ